MTSINEVIQRAKDASIETETQNVETEDGSIEKFDYILMPSGKEKRKLSINSEDKASKLLSINFEKFTFLSDYDAIANLENGEIEAILSSREPMGMFRFRRIMEHSRQTINEDDEISEENEYSSLIASGPNNSRLEISKSTEAIKTLSRDPRNAPTFSLKIFLGKILNYDSAVSALEVISDSLFFQMDIDRGVTLSLRKWYRRRRPFRTRRHGAYDSSILQFPAYEYDSAPISLYWYARSAVGMPLLQFLAYYQVAEYYFPNYSRLEAIRSARKILKNPTFRVDREADLTKLIMSISGNGRAGSSEREQMKATVNEVLTLDDVSQYFEERKDVGAIVEKKQKGITDKTINISRKNHDHRPDIAELLYDIRCRIVHTKNEIDNSKSEMLLPFSTEEQELWAYIDLMQFVAQHSLIRASSVLRNF